MSDSKFAGELSIIILVHNDEATLATCFESISKLLAQGAEVIVIDDGSTDGSTEIARRWVRNRKAILVEKPWSGVGHSRNVGLEVSTRSWITFLDSDDRILDKGILCALARISETQLDVVRCTNRVVELSDRDWRSEWLVPQRNSKSLGSSILEPTTGLHGVLYRREYLTANQITFPDCQIGEDLILNLKVFSKEPRFLEVPEIGYEYLVGRGGQVTSKRYSATKLVQDFDSVIQDVRDEAGLRKQYWKLVLRATAGALRRNPSESGPAFLELYRRSQQLPRGRRESAGAMLSLTLTHRRNLIPYLHRLISKSQKPIAGFL